jgi:hypothetical protein
VHPSFVLSELQRFLIANCRLEIAPEALPELLTASDFVSQFSSHLLGPKLAHSIAARAMDSRKKSTRHSTGQKDGKDRFGNLEFLAKENSKSSGSPSFERQPDIVLLALLRSTAKQNDGPFAIFSKVHPVAGAEIDLAFVNASSTLFALEKLPSPRLPG